MSVSSVPSGARLGGGIGMAENPCVSHKEGPGDIVTATVLFSISCEGDLGAIAMAINESCVSC